MTLLIILIASIIAINIVMWINESRMAKKMRDLLRAGKRTEPEVSKMSGETWQDYTNRVLGVNNQRKDK